MQLINLFSVNFFNSICTDCAAQCQWHYGEHDFAFLLQETNDVKSRSHCNRRIVFGSFSWKCLCQGWTYTHTISTASYCIHIDVDFEWKCVQLANDRLHASLWHSASTERPQAVATRPLPAAATTLIFFKILPQDLAMLSLSPSSSSVVVWNQQVKN